MTFIIAFFCAFFGMFILLPIVFGISKLFGIHAIVEEGTTHVYVLFGKVLGVLEEPGIHFLWLELGLAGPIINIFGQRYILDRRLDQAYLRSQPVNSEEGAPMGIGVWFESRLTDPVAYLFKNADPRGSLVANVSNATVRCLSNMKLSDMLETRHVMSQAVRGEVSPKSQEWGFTLGSVYIRKVHFRDAGMIRQIEEKVVNRLRQVTSAIRQDGTNQVNIITSTAEREAAIEFAKAAAMRPRIVGEALQNISSDPEVLNAMFDILETQRIVEGGAKVTFIPPKSELLAQLLAAKSNTASTPAPPTA